MKQQSHFYMILNLLCDKDHMCRPFVVAAVYKIQEASNRTIWHGTTTRKSQNHNSRKAVQLNSLCGMC